MISWIILSLGLAILIVLIPLRASALGISTLLAGLNWKDSSLNCSMVLLIQSIFNPSSVSGFNPGVIFPGRDFSLS